jgi:hypothetical protein
MLSLTRAQWRFLPLVSEARLDCTGYNILSKTAGNTTAFTSLRLSPTAFNSGIWGSASTGTCSILFGLTTNGYLQLKSKEIAGDIHSLAWTANGQNLHALDSHSSPVEATSIVNFRISEDPNLEDIIATDILANVSHAAEIVSHPTSNRLYVVTKDTNELISVRAPDIANSSSTTQLPSRYRLLPSSLDASRFHTSSLAIGASKSTLWALSQSSNQAVITVFSLNATTGEVVDAVARASWAGNGEGRITAASFAGGDIVAITNSPIGYVTLLGLDQGGVKVAQDADGGYDHAYLEALKMERSDASHINAASAKVKSYGRTALDEYIAIGEAVWVD